VRGEFLDLGGARLYYYAAGTRGAGEPVVFLHGFPTSGHLWNDVVTLMPPGHRLVVVDLLGYGRSDRPLARPVDIRAHAARIVALLDELRIRRACIVGHGIGGGIAQSLAIRHRDRVSHLCLVSSVAFDHWLPLGVRVAAQAAPAIQSLPPWIILGILRRKLRKAYEDSEHAARSVDLYLRPFSDEGGRAALLAHLAALSTTETAELEPELKGISVPTAIAWGQHDGIVPLSIGRRLQMAIPGASLEVIPGTRHFTPEEAPQKVADVIGHLLARA
jgi:pimeloyl-ACP methyl ester carboxylesterase